jgi:hypothetical protein
MEAQYSNPSDELTYQEACTSGLIANCPAPENFWHRHTTISIGNNRSVTVNTIALQSLGLLALIIIFLFVFKFIKWRWRKKN